MAEDIKDESLENESTEQNEEISSDGLIPEESEETPLDNSEEQNDESTVDNQENTSQSDSNEDQNDTEQEEVNTPDEPEHEYTEEYSVQQKQSKLQKILIITIGVLASTLVLGFILYLFGVFDPEPPKPTPTEQVAMDNNQTKKPEKYIFDPKDINIDRLNGKLRILTKYEIIGTAQEERQKELEKNSELSTQQINKLLEAERKTKEQKIAKQKTPEEENKEKEQEKLAEQKAQEEENKEKEQDPYDLLKFIEVSVNEEALLNMKEDFEKLNVSISKCEDRTRSFLLIGPFKSNKDLNSIFRPIFSNITQSATKKDLVRLEFNRICK